ncbi:MAG: cytochrome-c peroxidase [Sphingomonas sp.]
MRRADALLIALGALLLAVAAARAPSPATANRAQLSAVAQLGEKMFFDSALSASGRQSCASCHDPAHHFGPPNARSVQLGGADGRLPGIRAVPSLAYLDRSPPFGIGPPSLYDTDAIVAVPNSVDAGARPATRPLAGQPAHKKGGQPNDVPQGGLFWDGRADTFQQQAMGPLLSPFEMANRSEAALLAKLRRAPYARDFKALFGEGIFDNPELALDEAGFALARFQVEDPRFHPYSSKYDAYLRGEATLTPAEARGLKLFDDPEKGNCAACHLDTNTPDGRPPAFTDHEYEALAVPRNRAIPANRDPAYHDLGICGPLRDDAYAKQAANCGLFKTPTLRNVATRRVFFHNGVYHSLKQVLRFYADRDARPGAIYPRRADGTVAQFDDVPARYRANVDRIDAPFGRAPGSLPALTEREMDDIIAFLNALTDQ